MASAYHIVDEPLPGPIHRAVVRPLWPLFAAMLAGSWMAWPWFAVNAWAMKSPRLGRTLAWVAGGVAGAAALAALTWTLSERGALPDAALPYLRIVLTVWKLLVAYALTLDQERSFELHRYFGGKVANGMWVMLVGAFVVRDRLLGAVGELGPEALRVILIWVLS